MSVQNDDPFNETKLDPSDAEEEEGSVSIALTASALESFAKRLGDAIRTDMRAAVASMPESEFEQFAAIMKGAGRLLKRSEQAAAYFRYRARPVRR